MAYKYPICDVFHGFCKKARFFATEPPQVICTTIPRPIKIIRDLIADKRTVETRGNTLDNASNLNPQYLERVVSKYQGTRLGRQELNGDLLDDNPEALWKRADIDNYRVRTIPQLSLVVVGVDPAVTFKAGSDDTGIVVAGKGIEMVMGISSEIIRFTQPRRNGLKLQ